MAGFWRSLLGVRDDTAPPVVVPKPRHAFAIGDDYATWKALVNGAAVGSKISRADAMATPAVHRARDLICNTIATLPLHGVNQRAERIDRALLRQPEQLQGLVRMVTIARTVEDLLFEGSALWLVVSRDAQGFPQIVEHIRHGGWHQEADGAVYVNGSEVDTSEVIIFTSPTDPLLISGAPAIRMLRLLEATAARYAEAPEPAAYFTPRDDDPADPDEVAEFLDQWAEARRARATAYVPNTVELHSVNRTSPEDMQLVAAREFAVTEISRLTGVDADWLSVNTTSRTYLNAQNARQEFLDFVLAPFLHAIEDRLSLNDVTPNGQFVRFNVDAFLRADTLTRYQAHGIALDKGFLTINEVRDLENKPPLEDNQ